MAKLWDKGYQLDDVVERFTVGRDYILDRELIVADVMASVAHVEMLRFVGLLTEDESEQIIRKLREIGVAGTHRSIEITREDEDCHTVIERLLTEALGDVGKKVHTGRSRNDQITVATRLYTRETLIDIFAGTIELVQQLLDRAEAEAETVMPGRTHMQIAMLSTFGLWLSSWAEQLLDDLELLHTVARLNDRSPLGSAASYGTSLPLDREFIAERLGFLEVQNNVLSVQHSRGTLDARITTGLAGISHTLGRVASDLILFALPEIGYVELPDELCSGSSIMPQKKNPDALELLRARANTVAGWGEQATSVTRNLPSGYNRDLQDTKEPLLRTLAALEDEISVANVLVRKMTPRRDRMKAALNAEVFATDYAYQLVEEGVPFRDAYLKAANEYQNQPLPDAGDALIKRRSTGTPGNLNLSQPRQRLEKFRAQNNDDRERHQQAIRRNFPDGSISAIRPGSIYKPVDK